MTGPSRYPELGFCAGTGCSAARRLPLGPGHHSVRGPDDLLCSALVLCQPCLGETHVRGLGFQA